MRVCAACKTSPKSPYEQRVTLLTLPFRSTLWVMLHRMSCRVPRPTSIGCLGLPHQHFCPPFLQEILKNTKIAKGQISAFVELHIEQGPLLEKERYKLGVVTAIAAPASFRLQFNGGGGHAGALLMKDR